MNATNGNQYYVVYSQQQNGALGFGAMTITVDDPITGIENVDKIRDYIAGMPQHQGWNIVVLSWQKFEEVA